MQSLVCLFAAMAPKQPWWQRKYKYAGQRLETGAVVGNEHKSKATSKNARASRRQERSEWCRGALEGAHRAGNLGLSWKAYRKMAKGLRDDQVDSDDTDKETAAPASSSSSSSNSSSSASSPACCSHLSCFLLLGCTGERGRPSKGERERQSEGKGEKQVLGVCQF